MVQINYVINLKKVSYHQGVKQNKIKWWETIVAIAELISERTTKK